MSDIEKIDENKQEIIDETNKITQKMCIEAFDAWASFLYEQYRKHKQAELSSQTNTNKEY